jgi:glycosyltransferase involved in cell wall biosynthesis
MKIAVCSVQIPFTKGGTENLTTELYRELIKRGYDTDYINIPFKWYPPNEIMKGILTWRMLDLVESNGEKIDLLICTKFPSYVVKHPNKVVWLIHQFRQAYELYGTTYGIKEMEDDTNDIRTKIIETDNKTFGECKKIYTISNNVSSRLMRYNKIKSKTLYPPPKNADKFFCRDLGDYIIYPSRIDSQKRQRLLIEAMQFVKNDVKIMIVGKGHGEEELRKLANKLKVENNIKFCGYVPDDELLNLYANALGVFYAPYDEDYGYITAEALLSRKPVITTSDSGGPLEFIENGINGYILKPYPQEIAKKIDFIFENREIAKDLGMNGYKKINNMNITWDNVIDKLVN